MSATLRPLLRDTSGSTLVEFSILAPLLITMMVGVLQVGLWMQTYNALRSAANDTGRYVTVEYQKANRIGNLDIAIWARNRALSNAYQLKDAGLSTQVIDASTQSITNVTEKTLTINYSMPSFLQIIGIGAIPVSYSRPIFVKST